MIKKAVLPVAGLGTRFLPASKSIPKEMVTVVDRPAIDYVVKEAVTAGIEQIILVTHSSKASIENYFDRNFELEVALAAKHKSEMLPYDGRLKYFVAYLQQLEMESNGKSTQHNFTAGTQPIYFRHAHRGV